MQPATFATIDIGTYDVTLEIFEISRKSGIKSIDTVRHRLELGTDTYANGKLGPSMEEELCLVLKDFVRIMDGYKVENYRAIATSALREAENALFVLGKIRQATGLHVEVLSNSEQRFLSYKAIASIESRFNKMIEKGTAVVDVDGGSIQISLFDKDALVTTQNIRMGNLRIRERLQPLKNNTANYERLAEELLQNEIISFKRMYLKDRKIENIMLIGDFLTDTIFRNTEDRASRTISRKDFEAWYQNIVGHSTMELAVSLDVPVEYASLLRPSAIIYHRLIEEMDAAMIWTPGTHLARGLAYEYAEQKKLLKVKHDFENDIIMAAKNIGKRYAVNRPHIQNMEMTSMAIFDAMRRVYGLGERERLLLRIAVMLHDVGKYISMNAVAECSYNIIMSNEIIGLSHEERETIALIARYNTKELPSFEELVQDISIDERQYLLVAELTAIVRYANALDRSHMQKIQAVRAALREQELRLSLEVNRDFTLEQGLLEDKAAFFYEVFSVKPVIKIKRQI
ncbi:MAG TPA: HD domain-containing protein [Candidatus Scatomonas pullistercoris]|uniref:HD domain-containing protein n=1 Tax=Candidatus Scatomonas pullistercoris TaxID=2840920 RepID=A0A9D1P1J1_9FIRM|nr:HD domain-containing protein [Candidatus Scatomonas pullistercoris]